MTNALRWRVLVLQAGLVLILGFVAGFASGGRVHPQLVTTQLAAQNITFRPTTARPSSSCQGRRGRHEPVRGPGDDHRRPGPGLGQRLHQGPPQQDATYDAASALARANPTSTVDAQTEATVFQGTTLRGMLLNAYGWWTVGTYALFAAIGLTIAAGVVLLTFVFELFRWRVESARPARQPCPLPRSARRGRCRRSASPR